MDAARLPAPVRDRLARIGWEVIPGVLRDSAGRYADPGTTAELRGRTEGDLDMMAVVFRAGRSAAER